MVGRSLRDARVLEQTGAQVVARRAVDGGFTTNPDPETVLSAGEVLIVVGTATEIEALLALAEPAEDGSADASRRGTEVREASSPGRRSLRCGVLDDYVRELASGPNFAAFTTVLPSGRFATHIMWVDCDEEHLLINTEVHRQKFKNVSRDPRVTVTVWEAERPNRYAEARGRVVDTVTGPDARAHIDKLAQKYTGRPYPNQAITSERVILVIEPERQRLWDVGRDATRR